MLSSQFLLSRLSGYGGHGLLVAGPRCHQPRRGGDSIGEADVLCTDTLRGPPCPSSSTRHAIKPMRLKWNNAWTVFSLSDHSVPLAWTLKFNSFYHFTLSMIQQVDKHQSSGGQTMNCVMSKITLA